jgi:type I site-specific restriction endonuclease
VCNKRAQQATAQFSPNEELTRILIDQQLTEAGWEADTQLLSYARGARPEMGKNKAIAEWPTVGKQAADYMLFAGMTPIAGVYSKPEDYLQSFNEFIRNQVNQSAALSVVVNRPKDLTREQLKEVRLLLDEHHFAEASLQSAWRRKTNQDIAASIIGYIRQAALGEALLPFEQCVAHAMERIYAQTNWTPVQRTWLGRLGGQFTHEVVLDQQFVNQRFNADGGAMRLNLVLGGQLDQVLATFAEALWPQAA